MPISVQAEDYSLVVKLLLAQYVYELGEHRFGDIAENLRTHPLLLRQAEPVPDSAEKCEELYDSLLASYSLERGEVFKGGKKPPTWVKTLAQKLYMAYSDQLLKQIADDETEFKQVFGELEKLKAQSS
uniref:ARAD1C40106p n=1 Tax=Blastobotrys adeninivorans TaxID=409370 RepID=A0A060T3F5_BLAAD